MLKLPFSERLHRFFYILFCIPGFFVCFSFFLFSVKHHASSSDIIIIISTCALLRKRQMHTTGGFGCLFLPPAAFLVNFLEFSWCDCLWQQLTACCSLFQQQMQKKNHVHVLTVIIIWWWGWGGWIFKFSFCCEDEQDATSCDTAVAVGLQEDLINGFFLNVFLQLWLSSMHWDDQYLVHSKWSESRS